ncbi:hypothetical protein NEOLEDRAFT_1167826 [Neolentinus lepideus HHB14362 ss-1]|uniref:Uncharacterized protein n=1 Tax=Neolentinus lepideus HHB14362 ss-1 TaxID=1314782 RepID=A0A165UHA4_9AGAM|nr:hypothetical protein NEOLEDRAFT_1167826 [Neolentinus lepideus HHB14362 ss-1]
MKSTAKKRRPSLGRIAHNNFYVRKNAGRSKGLGRTGGVHPNGYRTVQRGSIPQYTGRISGISHTCRSESYHGPRGNRRGWEAGASKSSTHNLIRSDGRKHHTGEQSTSIGVRNEQGSGRQGEGQGPKVFKMMRYATLIDASRWVNTGHKTKMMYGPFPSMMLEAEVEDSRQAQGYIRQSHSPNNFDKFVITPEEMLGDVGQAFGKFFVLADQPHLSLNQREQECNDVVQMDRQTIAPQ